jgi:ferrous iron transport protein A
MATIIPVIVTEYRFLHSKKAYFVTAPSIAVTEDATMSSEPKPVATQQITLDQLPLGEPGVVVRVGGEKATKRRLLDMGMLPGEIVKVKKVAPLGDPLELEIKHYQLSLRKHEAHQIIVEVV